MVIKDGAFVLFVSQSNNAYQWYPIELLSVEDTERFILDRVKAIKNQKRIDCSDSVKYDPCAYCSYSKDDCEGIIKNTSGDFGWR